MSKFGVLAWRKIFESGDAKRLAKQQQNLDDLNLILDIPYLDDDEQGHLLDIYELHDLPEDAPVLIDIHGGGLFASNKEVNVNFNYEWARRGYRVVSISYRRIPETTLWHQIDDCMAAIRFLEAHQEDYHLNLNQCFITGDSAGALLSLFVMSINASQGLQEEFGIAGAGFSFRAGALISIMLDTQRNDLMRAISDMVTGRRDYGTRYEKYLLDPAQLVAKTALPPLFLVTSDEDMIQKDSLKLDRILSADKVPHKLLNFPKGTERKLIHVFAVSFPMYPESREVFSKISAFFRTR